MQKKAISLFVLFALVAISAMSVAAQKRFIANMSSKQEVPTNNSAGKAIGVVTLNAAETQVTVSITYSGMTTAVVASHIHGDAVSGVNAPVLFNFNYTGGTSGTITAGPFAITPTQVASLRAKKFYLNIHTTNFSGGEIRGQLLRVGKYRDYDGDGKDDISVTRPSNLTTYTINSNDNTVGVTQFGQANDSSATVDYDNDGISDLVRIRPNLTTGDLTVLILRSSDGTIANLGVLGNAGLGDQAVSGDFDGDGKSDIGAFRASTGDWRILESSTGQIRVRRFGQAGDTAIPGDYDKDGITNLCVVRNVGANKVWYILRPDGSFYGVQWGLATDTTAAVPYDIDGDGADDVYAARSIGGLNYFFVLRSSDNTAYTPQWGLGTDTYLIGSDYDGDGKDDLVAVRTDANSKLIWFIQQSATGTARIVQWGNQGDSF